MSAFNYNYEDDNRDPYFEERQFRPITHISNGGIYKGEWLVTCFVTFVE